MSIMDMKQAGRPRLAGKLRRLGAVAVLGIGASGLLASAPAEAHSWHRHHHHGGAVAAGVIGGLALGAIAGSAIASPPPTVIYEDDYPPAYGPYVGERLPSCSDFRRVDWRRRLWFDDYGRAHPCY